MSNKRMKISPENGRKKEKIFEKHAGQNMVAIETPNSLDEMSYQVVAR